MNHPPHARHPPESVAESCLDLVRPRHPRWVGEAVMKSIIEGLSRHEASFVQGWVIIKGIRDYLSELSDSPPAFPGLSVAASTFYNGDSARSELQRWQNAFERTFQNIDHFNAMRDAGQEFNYNDWRLMDESVETALQALRNKLEKLAIENQPPV